ncbi:hypothetical protein XENOCAPTIV_030891, partial [Xenoophorus captivus]
VILPHHSSSGITLHTVFLFLLLLASDGQFLWDNLSKVGKYDPYCDCYRGESWGWRNFIKYFDLRR